MKTHKKYDGAFEVIAETSEHQPYPIRPEHIRAGKAGSMLSTFGKAEIEEPAERLVLFFQSKGYWCRFKLEELQRFYKDQEKGWNFNTAFFGLMGAWYDDCMMGGGWREPNDVFIAVDPNGYHYVTDRFILRCANAADPASFLRMFDAVLERLNASGIK